MKKHIIKLTERDLKTIISNTVNTILKESAYSQPYTIEDWHKDRTLKPQIGQYVTDDVINQLINAYPPKTYTKDIIQPGEAYSAAQDGTPLYMTFVSNGNMWQYIGLCPKGSTTTMPPMY